MEPEKQINNLWHIINMLSRKECLTVNTKIRRMTSKVKHGVLIAIILMQIFTPVLTLAKTEALCEYDVLSNEEYRTDTKDPTVLDQEEEEEEEEEEEAKDEYYNEPDLPINPIPALYLETLNEHTDKMTMDQDIVMVQTWAELRSAVDAASIPITIIVTEDIIIPSGAVGNTIVIPVGRDITLTGGYALRRQPPLTNQRHFLVDGTLRLENITISGSSPTITTSHGGIAVNTDGRLYLGDGSKIINNRHTSANQGGGVTVSGAGATFIMTGGAINGNSSNHVTSAGGVFVSGEGATFTMSGGEINGNTAANRGAGGVFVGDPGHFTFTDGAIRNNTAHFGGGVRVGLADVPLPFPVPPPTHTSTMLMTGGEIYGNTAFFGGGINIEWGALTMIGGTIHNNTATSYNNTETALQAIRGGGGVFIQNGGLFNMNGGEIHHNQSNIRGGGVHVIFGRMHMTAGVIHNNRADNAHPILSTNNNEGGGVAVQSGGATTIGSFIMSGGTIRNNTATHTGGGVSVATNNSVFDMTGGTIQDNISDGTGGGVSVQNTVVFNMSGGTIAGNTAATNGGGIWLATGNISNSTGSRLNMTAGTISNNRAAGDGGGIFANPTSEVNILPANAYQNIAAATGIFYGNTAGGGLFAPPANADTRTFGHLLTNHNINFRGPNRLVIFNLNGGNMDGNTADIQHNLPSGLAIGTSNVVTPTRQHYTFKGWRYTGQNADTLNLSSDTVAEHILTESITFTAQWTRITHTVTFDLAQASEQVNGNLVPLILIVSEGKQIESQNVPSPIFAGHDLIGWQLDGQGAILSHDDVAVLVIYSDVILVAVWVQQPSVTTPVPTPMPSSTPLPTSCPTHSPMPLPKPTNPISTVESDMLNELDEPTPSPALTPQPHPAPLRQPETEFHARFMIGFPNGNFMPRGYITRAETAALLVRTMTTHFGVNVPRVNVDDSIGLFSDVSPGAWFYDYVGIAHSYGLIQGFPDGSFRPNSPITREQFAAMIVRATTGQASEMLTFTDAANISNWAFDYVSTAFALGLMIGDVSGAFRPLDPITRAEAAAAINRILGRGDTTARSIQDVSNVIFFPDVADENVWFFYYVVEATNSHWFIKDGYEEIWVEVE